MWRPTGCEGLLRGAMIVGVLLLGCSPSADRAPAAATSPAVTVAAAALKSATPAGTFIGRVQAVNSERVSASGGAAASDLRRPWDRSRQMRGAC